MNFVRLSVIGALLVAGAWAVPASRWQWLADAADNLHLVDTLEAAVEPRFDGGEDVTLYLYTQNNPDDPEYIKLGDASSSPSFNPANPTRFIVHGWVSGAWLLEDIKDAYIATGGEYNIVLVDWSGLASNLLATTALLSSIQVGEYTGKVINEMIETRGLNPDTLSIIGHSMGGHVAGIIGNRVGGEDVVAEVIGLDPAFGMYDLFPKSNRLDTTDAKFVEVIHTHGGAAGVLNSIGDADFYPNGGSMQVGCITQLSPCSHLRALTYFAESITKQNFVATKCSSYDEYIAGECSSNDHVVMGEWTPVTKSGDYYLQTNRKSPYGQGETDL